MARISWNVTVGANLGGGHYTLQSGRAADISTATALTVTDAAPVAAALAVLVADGASPTQAHVTTLNNAYTTLAADITAANAAQQGDVVLSINNSTITTRNQLKAAIRALLHRIEGDGSLTG